jgi:phage replication initiation protein
LDVYSWGTKNNVKITRLDIAHDDLEGSIVNIKNARKWIEQGLFQSSGRPPNIRTIDDHDSGKGKTIYIGERKNGRLIRIYEKGKQLGDKTNSWCRAELETRSKDRKIEWDTVLNPDYYLSGSCKALSYLSEIQSKIKTLSKAKTISLEHAIKYCRIGYGQLINTLEYVEGYEPEEIVEMLKRKGIPEKLKHKYAFANE